EEMIIDEEFEDEEFKDIEKITKEINIDIRNAFKHNHDIIEEESAGCLHNSGISGDK
ncbi:29119_t:CDS:2, partial [Gigaspora margarita]